MGPPVLSSVGIGLADTLDFLISSNEITPQLAVRIMERVGILLQSGRCDPFYLTNIPPVR